MTTFGISHLPKALANIASVRLSFSLTLGFVSAHSLSIRCLAHILAPGAHARLPMVDRMHELKIPVTFVYGDHDWMDPAGGAKSVENMKAAGNPDGRLYVVTGAGHHGECLAFTSLMWHILTHFSRLTVYLDNAAQVDKLILQELARAPSRTPES